MDLVETLGLLHAKCNAEFSCFSVVDPLKALRILPGCIIQILVGFLCLDQMKRLYITARLCSCDADFLLFFSSLGENLRDCDTKYSTNLYLFLLGRCVTTKLDLLKCMEPLHLLKMKTLYSIREAPMLSLK